MKDHYDLFFFKFLALFYFLFKRAILAFHLRPYRNADCEQYI